MGQSDGRYTDEELAALKIPCLEPGSRACDAEGYPIAKLDKKTRKVYRAVYQLVNGNVPKGTVLRHICDNRRCVRPEHIRPGTHADNVADRVRRGRCARGRKNGRARLTEEDVRKIRGPWRGEPLANLAKRLRVDPKTVRMARDGKTWKHIEVQP